jgi:diguanylate cyclase (GGDEF)-like protein
VLLQPVQTDVARSRGLLDCLTGLPGRVLLLDRLEQALTRARTHGTLATFVLLDVHQLSAVNAEHGFDQGDELLTTLAGRLRRGLRADHTVARYGGDEFAVIAEHPNGTGEPVAERIRRLAAKPVQIGGVRVRPGLRLSWVTSDGVASVLSVLTRAEEHLRR